MHYLDVNECDGANECHTDSMCSNTDGSHECTCKIGYSGDGRQCSGDISQKYIYSKFTTVFEYKKIAKTCLVKCAYIIYVQIVWKSVQILQKLIINFVLKSYDYIGLNRMKNFWYRLKISIKKNAKVKVSDIFSRHRRMY